MTAVFEGAVCEDCEIFAAEKHVRTDGEDTVCISCLVDRKIERGAYAE